MRTNRRTFLGLGLGALALAGCGSRVPAPGTQAVEPWPTAPNPAYDRWVAAFRDRAERNGISRATLNRAFSGAGYVPAVVERDRNQTEFKRSLEDYLAIAASDERVAKGREMMQRHGPLLRQIEARYGVEPQIVTAIWGLESRYGARRGEVPAISALSTLAYDGRRGAFYEKQLMAALRILQNGDTTPARMKGSWAGAMGHTQFIPTTYEAYAVDFTGDGRRDIWSDDPTDALASAAAYLKRSGWKHGQPWGGEVGSSAAAWGAPKAVIQPQVPGPKFVIYNNFKVIKRYNNSDSYALGIGHLSDRIAGGGPLKTPFGPDENGLTLEDRKELQRRLTAKGFDAGAADGVLGSKSRAAIGAYQDRVGLPVTGEPSADLLARLRRG